MDKQIEAGSVYSLDSLLQNQNHLNHSVLPSLFHEGLCSEQGVSLPDTPFSSNLPFQCHKSFVETSDYCTYGGCLPLDTKFVNPQNYLSTRFSNELSLSLAANPQVSFTKPLLGSVAFLQAAQEILAEIASFALDHNNCFSSEENSHSHHALNNSIAGFSDQKRSLHEAETKKSHLLALLQLVDEQYKQCMDDIHTVISAFHEVTDVDPNLHSRFALPRISNMYKNLRERISNHIITMGTEQKEGEIDSKQWSFQQFKNRDHIWKPQRGLPEQSVSVLKAWMFQNFLHPYPRDAEKQLLALKSGLTRSQVSNWFINARVRLWKPMIEEMYAEMNDRKQSWYRSIKNNQESSAASKTSSSTNGNSTFC